MAARKTLASLAAALIAVGIGGYAYVVWDQRQPVSDEDAAAIVDRAQGNLEAMQNELSQKIEGREDSESEERSETLLGQALFHKCLDLTELYDLQPSEATRASRDKACAEYSAFVEDGTIPPE